MAIHDSPETTSSGDGDRHVRGASLRRRQAAASRSVEPVLDSDSNSMETESATNDGESETSDANLSGNLGEGVVESANEEQETESASEGLSSGKEKGKNVKENGESSHDRGADLPTLQFAYRPSAPAHRKNKESPLSSDAIFKQSHAGLFNLCIVVLVAVNSRLIIENLMKYGWLIKAGFWFSPKSLRDWPLLMCCLTLPIFPLAAFLVEKLVKQKHIPEWAAVLLHVLITTTVILYPVVVILRWQNNQLVGEVRLITGFLPYVDCCNTYNAQKDGVFGNPYIKETVNKVTQVVLFDSAVLSGVTLMLFACIVWLKLVSYAHTNYDLRVLGKSIDKWEALSSYWNMDYSYDVSFKSLAYFVVAPTLCYQPSYPRTASIRKGWVVRQLIKLVIFTGLMGFIIEQYINPIVKNSQHPLKGDLLYAVERVLKLSVPNLYVWLCMFYCFFHLWLNILAELLRFGDREFYKDWWNAKTVEEYWRMWNMPVHRWMVRHIYFPCLRNGIPKGVAVLVAFLVSAVFHELCIAVPCHIFKFWAFIGIMFQVPLVIVTNYLQNKFKNSMVGNMMFWCFFCIVGQPMCVLLYYHDLMNRKASAR